MELNMPSIADRVHTEAEAYEFLEELRWDGMPYCPHCGSTRVYYLRPMDGTEARKTRTGSISERRVWKCGGCRKQFSVLTGTIFHGTKIPVKTWLMVVFEMCSSKNGVAAREIERKYDMTPKSAWFMLHRIREAMGKDPLAGLLVGTIVADETWYGGKPSNRHAVKRPQNRVQGKTDKQPIVALINKETGEVRSMLVPRVTGENLAEVLRGNVDIKRSVLHTDESNVYKAIGPTFRDHQAVNHGAGEYVRGDASTNMAEGHFSQLKRSLDGTHHHVTVKHLHRYLGEFDFRYSTRKVNDDTRTRMVFKRVTGKRMSYKPLSDD